MAKVVLLGAGNMGGALLNGWIANWKRAAHFHVVDPVATTLAKHPQVTCYRDVAALPVGLSPDIVIIAVKPDKVLASLNQLKPYLDPATSVVSVAAGVTIGTIKAVLDPATPVMRIMPNIGAMAGYSVSAGFAGPEVPSRITDLLEDMFAAIGQMSWLEAEEHLHIVTAVSGSGPAYFLAFCEALCDAAAKQGLPAKTAKSLAVGTAVAAGRLLEANPQPESLRRMVTSPNGTTAAGLAVLMADDSLVQLVRDTVEAARERSVDLAGT